MRQYNNITIERHSGKRGLTLMELLIAITLMALIVLSFSSIDLFSRSNVLGLERRSQIQNEVSYVLEHMSKEIGMAIGDATQPPVIRNTPAPGSEIIRAWIDGNPYASPPVSPNGRRDSYSQDHGIAYFYSANSIRYCPNCDPTTGFLMCLLCAGKGNILSSRITRFVPTYIPSNNFVEVELTVCWDPASATWSCGTPDNPSVTMRTRIKMPSVSTN